MKIKEYRFDILFSVTGALSDRVSLKGLISVRSVLHVNKMIIAFQSRAPTTVSDLHTAPRYRTSIYERSHRYLYSTQARL